MLLHRPEQYQHIPPHLLVALNLLLVLEMLFRHRGRSGCSMPCQGGQTAFGSTLGAIKVFAARLRSTKMLC